MPETPERRDPVVNQGRESIMIMIMKGTSYDRMYAAGGTGGTCTPTDKIIVPALDFRREDFQAELHRPGLRVSPHPTFHPSRSYP